MFSRPKTDVLVVGSGPVGLVAALVLARNGVAVRIIDESEGPATRSYALALHPASLEILDELGLAAPVLRRARRLESVALYDGAERCAALDLSGLRAKYPFLAILPQGSFEELLSAALKENGVVVEWNRRLSRIAAGLEAVDVSIDTLEKDSGGYAVAHMETVVTRSRDEKVPFVLAADGHDSLVRTQLGIKFESVRPAQNFAVLEFLARRPLPDEVRVVLDEGTANVLWPMRERRYRWSFEITDLDADTESRLKDRLLVQVASDFPWLQSGRLQRLAAERAPWFDDPMQEHYFRIFARFEQRLAQSFGKGRVWLAGDAGHMTGPVGVQSMNVGLREAFELATAYVRILQKGASPEELSSYGEGRLAEWRYLLGREAAPTLARDAAPWIAARAERLLPCIPASGAHLSQLLEQLGFQSHSTPQAS